MIFKLKKMQHAEILQFENSKMPECVYLSKKKFSTEI